jgi:hypothetical protein
MKEERDPVREKDQRLESYLARQKEQWLDPDYEVGRMLESSLMVHTDPEVAERALEIENLRTEPWTEGDPQEMRVRLVDHETV